MADLWLNRTAAFATLLLSSCQLSRTAAGNVNRRRALVIVTSITSVDIGIRHSEASDLFGRRDDGRQRVAIVRIVATQIDSHDPVATIRRGHGHLLTELISLVSLPFADAHHVWFVQTVQLLFVRLLLSVKAFAKLQ